MGLTVNVQSPLIGSAPGYIHIVHLPCQTPMLLARCSCILPGVPASMQAWRSASVQPGGGLICGWAAAAGAEDLDGSPMAIERAMKVRTRATQKMGTMSCL